MRNYFREQMHTQGFIFLSGAPGIMPALHCHQEIEVNLITRGEMTYLLGARCLQLPAGRLTAFWAAIPHRVIFVSPEAEYYCMHLPLSLFLRWQLPGEFTSRMLHGEALYERDDCWFLRDLELFGQWRSDLRSLGSDTCPIILLELEARLRRMAGRICGPQESASDAQDAGSASKAIGKIEQVMAYISEHYREPITMPEIAAAVHLHPGYLMTLFRERCGITVADYVTQFRLSQAQRLLATTDNRVVDIAFESGFGSVSQFYDRFTRSCGHTPREYRAMQR